MRLPARTVRAGWAGWASRPAAGGAAGSRCRGCRCTRWGCDHWLGTAAAFSRSSPQSGHGISGSMETMSIDSAPRKNLFFTVKSIE